MRQPRPATYAAIAGIFFLNLGVSANWVPRIPAIQQHLRLSNGQLGLALLGVEAGSVLAMPLAGWLVGHIGSRRAALSAAMAYCTAIVLPATAGSLFSLAAALVALGATNGVLDVAMNTQAVQLEHATRRSVVPYFAGASGVGSLIGALMGTGAASLGVAPAPHLLAVGALFGALAAICSRHLLPTAGGPATRPTRPIRPSRALLALGFLGWTALFLEGAITDWSAVFFRQELRASPGAAGLGYAAFAGALCAGAIATIQLRKRFGPASVVRSSGALAAIGTLAVALSFSPAMALIGLAATGLALSPILPLVISTAGRSAGPNVGITIATVSDMAHSGFLAGPPLVGFISQATSLRVGIGSMSALALALIAFGAVVDKAQRPVRVVSARRV